MVASDYIRGKTYPLFRHDHHIKVVSINKWVKYILGVPPTKLSHWGKCLVDQHLLADFVIMKNMEYYCSAMVDIERHVPWTAIVNRIITIARKYIHGLPQSNFSDLFFVSNNSAIVIGNTPHSAQPDILVISRSAFSKPPVGGIGNEAATGITWDQVISCAEFEARDGHALEEAYTEWQNWVALAEPNILLKEKRRRRASEVSAKHHNAISYAHYSASQLESPPTPRISPSVFEEGRLSASGSSGIRKRELSSATFPLGKKVKMDEQDDLSELEDTFSDVEDDTFSDVEDDTFSDVEEAAANYASELLAGTSGTRNHCLQFLVDGSELQLWYCDMGGIIRSERVSWIKEFSKFAAIMVAFASLDASGWGVGIPNLAPPTLQLSTPPVLPTSLTGYSLTMAYRTQEDGKDIERNVRVELGKEITTQASLVGRRTTVYEVSTTPKISSVPLILKMSMQPTGKSLRWLRPLARRLGVRRLPHNLHNDALMILATLIISTSPFFAKPLVLVSSRKALNLRDASLSMFVTARTSR